jgi:hypothetical protein
MYGAKSSSL